MKGTIMTPLSEAKRKEAGSLVDIAYEDGINTLNASELRLVKRYLKELGCKDVDEAFQKQIDEKAVEKANATPKKEPKTNTIKPQKTKAKCENTSEIEILDDWPEGSFEHFIREVNYTDFANFCKANPNSVALFKKDLLRQTATDMTLRIRKARLKAFAATKGHFEARILPNGEFYSVYVKYVPQEAA